MELTCLHLTLALVLFFAVNWVGAHAVDFGYVSTTLFEEPNESIALNFFLRALSPAVFIIAVAAAFVAIGLPELRLGVVWVAVYYYAVRASIIFLLNRQGLISWPRYIGHALFGIAAATLAYRYLIVPNRSLIPDLDTAGNELWLAILAFLYAVANKVPLSGGPGARRRNRFVQSHYVQARRKYGSLIDRAVKNDVLKLVTYAILIYEDYCRPPAVRRAERLMWWKKPRTTGVMQVAADQPLSDRESVERGLLILSSSWAQYDSSEGNWNRVRSTIAAYNKDEDYVSKVFEVIEILAVRIESEFKTAYDRIFE